jgi:FMN reductase
LTRLVGVSAGESPESRTTALIAPVIAERHGELIELSTLSADGLLGRTEDPEVARAVKNAAAADVLVVATPIYRATYTAALKAFFDRFQPNGLAETAVVLVGTGIVLEHFLALDTSGRALVASLGGWTVPAVVYATRDDFDDGRPSDEVLEELRDAVRQAERLS